MISLRSSLAFFLCVLVSWREGSSRCRFLDFSSGLTLPLFHVTSLPAQSSQGTTDTWVSLHPSPRRGGNCEAASLSRGKGYPMGKKPVVALFGLVWVGITLTGCGECCRNGCRNKSSVSSNGRNTPNMMGDSRQGTSAPIKSVDSPAPNAIQTTGFTTPGNEGATRNLPKPPAEPKDVQSLRPGAEVSTEFPSSSATGRTTLRPNPHTMKDSSTGWNDARKPNMTVPPTPQISSSDMTPIQPTNSGGAPLPLPTISEGSIGTPAPPPPAASSAPLPPLGSQPPAAPDYLKK